MNIVSDPFKDTKSSKPKPGSYEWWYFDALDEESGLGVVVIFFDGNPFSTRYIEALEKQTNAQASGYPAVSISVYEHGKTLFYSFEEVDPSQASFSSMSCEGNVGNNRFLGEVREGRWSYELILEQTLASGEHFSGQFRFDANAVAMLDETREDERDSFLHAWNLVMPAGRMSGEMRLSGPNSFSRTMNGVGYHDHNTGLEPMKDSFQEWYWGRFHVKDQTFLFYLMHEQGHWSHKAWWIRDDGAMEPFEGTIELQDLQRNGFGLASARKIVGSGDHHQFTIQLDKVLDNGPYYQRFRGRLIAGGTGASTSNLSFAGASSGDVSNMDAASISEQDNRSFIPVDDGYDSLVTATGICEYIRPGRIYSRTFWPLVKMRIRYPGKPHWVQKSQRLYRWTW